METRLQKLQERYEQYIKAEDSILNGGQEYKIGTRDFKRADIKEISDMIRYLENEIKIEESKQSGGGRNRVLRGIPRDY